MLSEEWTKDMNVKYKEPVIYFKNKYLFIYKIYMYI